MWCPSLLVEILFYGRGGQGGVTAANILVLAALKQGLYGQGFPFFGAERRGAPIRAFARISDRPIRRHGMFDDADALVVLDPGLVKVGLTRNFKVRDKGIIVVNSSSRDLIVPDNFCLQGEARAFCVNATSIALRNKLVVAGWPVVNTAILGALARALGIVSIESVENAIKEYFGGEAGELNAKAAREAYQETLCLGKIK